MKKEMAFGIIGAVLGLTIGFIVGQEYLKYQIRTEISKGIENVGGLFGLKKDEGRKDQSTNVSKTETPKKFVEKEVPFDPERMSNEGYLKAKWGMTEQEVMDVTGAATEENTNLLFIKSDIAGEDASVVFYFIEHKLYKVVMFIEKHTSNHDNYIPIYKRVESLLSDKYGKAKKSIKRGSRNPYISDGMAIATGQGIYFAEWEIPETNISVVLKGDNYKMNLLVSYESKKYMPLAMKALKEKNKDKL